jgi:hypothetical protein
MACEEEDTCHRRRRIYVIGGGVLFSTHKFPKELYTGTFV